MTAILPHLPLGERWRHRASRSLLADESFRARGTYDGRRWVLWAYGCDNGDGLGRFCLLVSVPTRTADNVCSYVEDVVSLRCERVETLMAFLAVLDEGPGRTFVCPQCQRGMPWSMGAADNAPDICDDCWAERY